MVKVCCGTGKPALELSALERLGCNNDHYQGPISLEDYDLLLTGLGTFYTNECVSSEDLCKLLKENSHDTD